MLKEINQKLELLGEKIVGRVKYDFDFTLDKYTTLKTIFQKKALALKAIENKFK